MRAKCDGYRCDACEDHERQRDLPKGERISGMWIERCKLCGAEHLPEIARIGDERVFQADSEGELHGGAHRASGLLGLNGDDRACSRHREQREFLEYQERQRFLWKGKMSNCAAFYARERPEIE